MGDGLEWDEVVAAFEESGGGGEVLREEDEFGSVETVCAVLEGGGERDGVYEGRSERGAFFLSFGSSHSSILFSGCVLFRP